MKGGRVIPMAKSRILFVCLGNICRSPLAHGIMLKLVDERGRGGDVTVDSCGTGGWHIGEPAHRGSLAAARANGVDLSFHRARKFSTDDWSRFDWFVAMDRDNLAVLEQLSGGNKGRIVLLREYEPKTAMPKSLDVPDPYYSGNFDEVYSIVERCCKNLLEAVEEELPADRTAGRKKS